MDKPRLVIVTGYSGAGLSTALHALEDSGFYCIDNLPVEMIDSAVALVEGGRFSFRGFAFGMDIRDHQFSHDFIALKSKLAKRLRLDVLFLLADTEVLATRYSSTRRKHPLLEMGGDLITAIKLEQELLAPVRLAADTELDTSNWSPHFLARTLEARYQKDMPVRSLYLTISSFGFKYGQPRPLDSIFDIRFIANPFFISELKDKTGLDPEVRHFVLADPNAQEFLKKFEDMWRFLLPAYYREGKHYFRLGIGCTGGRHRSVCFVEEIARILAEKPVPNVVVNTLHRDLDQIK